VIKRITSHRIFIPALIAAIALTLGLLFAFEHSRNLVKVRGPYLIVLAVIISFPAFAFRFFDPHEDPRPMSVYLVLSALYYIMLGSPDLVLFFRMLLIEKLAPGATKQIALGFAAFAAIAGSVHFAYKIRSEHEGFLRVVWFKFAAYAVLQVVYLNLFVAIAREKFGITILAG